MRTNLLIATAATAALLAGAAFAQSATPDTAVNPEQGPASATSTPNANASTPAGTPDAVNPTEATVAPAAGAPAERTSAASVGGTDVVSNGPVPDTKENRAKYGKPMSNAGRMTKPAGN